MTIFVFLIGLLLVLNDIGEYIWGWPDYEFNVDRETSPHLKINLDMTVNMQCRYLSIDLRDALGDRLYLTGTIRRDGTTFDTTKATEFKEHADMLSARQAIAQSRSSRGLFDTLFSRRTSDGFKPTYDHKPKGDACRLWGSLLVKRVTANLHVTTLGHGYGSFEHVDHSLMNLSHVITEFSFGPHFPDITQPLDYTFEVAKEPFTAYQYFLHVVPTTYIAPRSNPLSTNQYSVTHYTRELQHDQGAPGIFFKFDLDPLAITIEQKTTSLVRLLIRCVGVIGGIFVCMGYAIRITTRAVEVVSGADQTPGIVAAEASGAKIGLKGKWGGSHLRARSIKGGKLVPQGSGWVMEGGSSSPYATYTNTPMSTGFPASPYTPHTPYTPHLMNNTALSPAASPGPSFGLSVSNHNSATNSPNPAFMPLPPMVGSGGRSPSMGLPYAPSGSGTPMYGQFPPTPNPANTVGFPESVTGGRENGNGVHSGPPPKKDSAGTKKDD
jgi:hypothetical protein